MKQRTLGILGGGQLAQMLALAAVPLGVRCLVLEPDPWAPARLCAEQLVAPYTDPAGLARLAGCDAVTLEFENVPLAATAALEGRVPLRPAPGVLHLSKHRGREKAALQAAGAQVAPYLFIQGEADLAGAFERLGLAHLGGLLKTAELGYDGKGQLSADTPEQLLAAWDALGRVPCVLERRVPFLRELSLSVARSPDGSMAFGPLIENVHRGGILRRSVFPAASPERVQAGARRVAAAVAEGWGVQGLITLEFFELEGGQLPINELLVNEVAPRVHNSGHLTQDGGGVSQFEAAVRSALGLPLADFARCCPAAWSTSWAGKRAGNPTGTPWPASPVPGCTGTIRPAGRGASWGM